MWGKLRDGAPGYQITNEGIQELLNSYSTPEAPFVGVLRGHQHMAACVSRFVPATGDWEPLSAKQIIEPGSVFTFMCLSPQVELGSQAGYGAIEYDEGNRLVITPHISCVQAPQE